MLVLDSVTWCTMSTSSISSLKIRNLGILNASWDLGVLSRIRTGAQLFYRHLDAIEFIASLFRQVVKLTLMKY